MTTKRSRLTKFTAAAMAVCVLGSTGCDAAGFFGSNLNLSFIIPTGFGGSPGFYNPFGLTQALVNALIGANTPSGDSGSDSSGDDSGSAIPATVGSLNAALN